MPITYSDKTNSYYDKWQQAEANKPDAYNSKYQSQIDSTLDKILNRKEFSYDFNADPLYQQYKDQYVRLGNEASMNAVANASALTGGYANSYATTAGAQANQQYLQQLNNVIPELYNMAMNKYQMEGDQLNNQYSVLTDTEDRAYGQYRDTVGDYQADRNYFQNAYDTMAGHDEWNAQFDENVRQFGLTYALQQASLQLEQDKFDWSKQQAMLKSSGGGGSDKTGNPSPAEKSYNSRNGNTITVSELDRIAQDIMDNHSSWSLDSASLDTYLSGLATPVEGEARNYVKAILQELGMTNYYVGKNR